MNIISISIHKYIYIDVYIYIHWYLYDVVSNDAGGRFGGVGTPDGVAGAGLVTIIRTSTIDRKI